MVDVLAVKTAAGEARSEKGVPIPLRIIVPEPPLSVVGCVSPDFPTWRTPLTVRVVVDAQLTVTVRAFVAEELENVKLLKVQFWLPLDIKARFATVVRSSNVPPERLMVPSPKTVTPRLIPP